MSRLIYKGNTVNNFGKFLPAPYIDKIAIYNYQVVLTTSIFVNSPSDEAESIAEEIDDEIYQYVIFLAEHEASDGSIVEFLGKEEDLFTILERSAMFSGYKYWSPTTAFDHAMSLTAAHWDTAYDYPGPYCYISTIEPFTEETDADEVINTEITYDEEGNRFVKYTQETTYDSDDYEMFPGLKNVYVLTFTTAVDINFDQIASMKDQKRNQYLKEISDVSYEKIIEDGEVVSQIENIWVDKNNFPYDDTPLQSITSNFYKAENITHQDIIDTFNNLLTEYDKAVEVDSKLKKAVDNIAYVLAIYGHQPQLMPQLNLLRKTFESKSTIDGVGKLYVRFRGVVFNVNKAIMQEDRLFKKLIVNPKIIDARDLPIVEEWEQIEVEDYGYNEILYDKWYIDTRVVYFSKTDTAQNAAFTEGYFFFDYKKLVDTCNAAQIFDISKLEQYFGDSIINTTVLRVKDAQLFKIYESDVDFGSMHLLMRANTSNNPQTTIYGHAGEIEPTGEHERSATMAIANERNPGEEYYSYLRLRSFNLAQSTGLGGYQLMCWEFRDIWDHQNIERYNAPFYYYATVETQDKTVDVIKDIISSYINYLSTFVSDYLEIARDLCGYNEFTGEFNDFFINGMESTYGSDLATAPWIMMPVVYNIHRDLLYDQFSGDTDKLIEDAKLISQKISPFTGTLTELELFYERILEIYNTFYDGYNYNLSDIADGTASAPETPAIPALLYTLEADSDANTREDSIYFVDMPDIYDSGEHAGTPDGTGRDAWAGGDGDDEDTDYGTINISSIWSGTDTTVEVEDVPYYIRSYVNNEVWDGLQAGWDAINSAGMLPADLEDFLATWGGDTDDSVTCSINKSDITETFLMMLILFCTQHSGTDTDTGTHLAYEDLAEQRAGDVQAMWEAWHVNWWYSAEISAERYNTGTGTTIWETDGYSPVYTSGDDASVQVCSLYIIMMNAAFSPYFMDDFFSTGGPLNSLLNIISAMIQSGYPRSEWGTGLNVECENEPENCLVYE